MPTVWAAVFYGCPFLVCRKRAQKRKGAILALYSEVCENLTAGAVAKAGLCRQKPMAVLISSVLAGGFIALGSIVFLATGGALTAAGCTSVKFFQSLVFSAALSLVIMAGSDLFTGSNLTMGIGVLSGLVKLPAALRFWALCWLGNFAGSLLVAGIYKAAGLAGSEATAAFIAATAAAKLSATPWQLFLKGILCNICVCLAVWCAAKLKSESGKLIMVVWCILIFMISGFEHSIANMSILGLALMNGSASIGGYAINLVCVTLGNFVGGFVFVALPYWYLSRPAKNRI